MTEIVLGEEVRAQHRAPYKGAFIDNSAEQEATGYPRALATLRSWSTDKLHVAHGELVRDSFGLFGDNALKLLVIVEKVIAERQQILAEQKE